MDPADNKKSDNIWSEEGLGVIRQESDGSLTFDFFHSIHFKKRFGSELDEIIEIIGECSP
jgi:hypothetical protein